MRNMNGNQLSLWSVDVAGLVACAGITATIYLFGILPLLEKRTEAAEAQATLAFQARQLRRLTAAHSDLNQNLVNLEESLPKTDVKLLPISHLNQRLDDLIQLAHGSHLTIDEIHPGEIINKSHHKEFMISLRGTGTYQTWTDFISRLHQKFPDIQVQKLMLEANAKVTPPIATSQMELIWFTTSN